MDKPIVTAELSRDLSLFHLTMMGLGMMIGAGVFLGIGNAIRIAGPGGVLLTFALNTLLALFTAMSYAELSSAIPRAGGAYNFARIGFGGGTSFLAGWMEWFASSVAGSMYGHYLCHLHGSLPGTTQVFVLAGRANASGKAGGLTDCPVFPVYQLSRRIRDGKDRRNHDGRTDPVSDCDRRGRPGSSDSRSLSSAELPIFSSLRLIAFVYHHGIYLRSLRRL